MFASFSVFFYTATCMYPLLFQDNFHNLVWGGHRLRQFKGLPSTDEPVGESWEISDIPTSESHVRNGHLMGRSIHSLIEEYGAQLLGCKVLERYGAVLPLLVKFIDAAQNLSVQVHPNEALALRRHDSLGKTEMWYVLKAEPGASLLCGFKEEISEEEYFRRVEDGTIIDVLARHEVHAGDVFFIPAGRVHTICKGIMVCEIQQSSDITYRIFDYHRLDLDGKPRKLHTMEALEAIDFTVYPDYRTHYTLLPNDVVCVVDCPYFVVNVLVTDETLSRKLLSKDSFVTLSCLQGAAIITDFEGNNIKLQEGYSCLVPASQADFTVKSADGKEVRLLEAWVK